MYRVYNICRNKMHDKNTTKAREGEMEVDKYKVLKCHRIWYIT